MISGYKSDAVSNLRLWKANDLKKFNMKNQFFNILIFILYFLKISCDNQFSCDSAQPKNSKLKIGDTTTLCIFFKETETKIKFDIEVDKFSLFNVAGGFLLSKGIIEKSTKLSNITMLASIFAKTTEYPSNFYYKDNEQEIYYPLINIVIKVEKGIIYDIVWDNNCYGCKKSECEEYESTSYFNESKIKNFENCFKICSGKNSFDCDPQFYVTWFGTDKDKR